MQLSYFWEETPCAQEKLLTDRTGPRQPPHFLLMSPPPPTRPSCLTRRQGPLHPLTLAFPAALPSRLRVHPHLHVAESKNVPMTCRAPQARRADAGPRGGAQVLRVHER